MPRTIIKKHTSALVKGLLARVDSLSNLEHKLEKGELRELFVSGLLNSFITSQFGISSGTILNQDGEQSRQMDIIIYDNRILPPFIKEGNIGVYPAESVIATLEVKSVLGTDELVSSEESAKHLYECVYKPESSIYGDYKYLRPLCAVIGFYGNELKKLSERENGKSWLDAHINYLSAICLANEYSWIKVNDVWTFCAGNKETNEETKRFIAVVVDNVRTYSEIRLRRLAERPHRDWLSIYIRDQE